MNTIQRTSRTTHIIYVVLLGMVAIGFYTCYRHTPWSTKFRPFWSWP